MHFSHIQKHFLKMHPIFLHFNRHFSVDKFNIIDCSNQVGFIPQNKISMIVIYLRVIAKLWKVYQKAANEIKKVNNEQSKVKVEKGWRSKWIEFLRTKRYIYPFISNIYDVESSQDNYMQDFLFISKFERRNHVFSWWLWTTSKIGCPRY